VVLAFSGDEFLIGREARKVLRAQGYYVSNTNSLVEEITGSKVKDSIFQGSLFGGKAVFLDFDSGFVGQSDTKHRNEVMKVLQAVPDDVLVVIVDSKATVGRKKAFSKLGNHKHLPTPRFDNLHRWVRKELLANHVKFESRVPIVLAELFEQDLGGILGEIEKMSSLDAYVTEELIYSLANQSSPQNTFELIEAIVRGETSRALMICEQLLVQGEEATRIFGVLNWQFEHVAKCVGLFGPGKEITPEMASRELKIQIFAAKKALSIARRLNEDRLLLVLEVLLDGEIGIKSGRDARITLGEVGIRMASIFTEA